MENNNNDDHITSWTMFFNLFIKNIASPINIIMVILGFISFISEVFTLKIRVFIIILCLFISVFLSLYKSLNKIFKSIKDLKNNRDTIINTYERYKENYTPYENICNEICIAIEMASTENPRNAALKRLKNMIDRIINKYKNEEGAN